LGRIYEARGEDAAAEKVYNAAIAQNPEWQLPQSHLARLYISQGKTDQAIATQEKTLARNPQNASAHLRLASIYLAVKDYQNAQTVYTRALEAMPNLWIAANNLAFLMSEYSESNDDLEKALALAKRATSQRPNDPAVLDSLGWIYYKTGDLDKAYDLIEKANAIAPDNGILNYHMGMVLYKAGRVLEAAEKLEKCIASEEAFHGRGEAETTLARLQESLEKR